LKDCGEKLNIKARLNSLEKRTGITGLLIPSKVLFIRIGHDTCEPSSNSPVMEIAYDENGTHGRTLTHEEAKRHRENVENIQTKSGRLL